ncbi:MAG: RNA methyltransferase, partial [Planctomycetota bacterium]|nr:RNA methyltransferase [Planctomycetota bacterium]
VHNRDPPLMTIESVRQSDDPRLEDFRDLRGRDQRGVDSRPGIFIGEQPLIVEAMLESPNQIRRILVSDRKRPWLEEILARHGHPEVEALVAPQEILESIVGFPIHRGVLASGNRMGVDDRSIDDLIPDTGRPGTLLVCESIRNIDNIGMLFRVAAAFGIDGVILSPDCHDPLYRKSLRVSIGHALRIPFARSSDWAADLAGLGDVHGFHRIGASIDGRTTADLLPPSDHHRVALVMGSEFDGLGDVASKNCDALVRIAMAPGVDSLNVAVAAAILLDRYSTAIRA